MIEIDWEKIRSVMRRQGINQDQMAEKLGVDRTTVWRWMNGFADIPTAKFFQLVGELGLPIAGCVRFVQE